MADAVIAGEGVGNGFFLINVGVGGWGSDPSANYEHSIISVGN